MLILLSLVLKRKMICTLNCGMPVRAPISTFRALGRTCSTSLKVTWNRFNSHESRPLFSSDFSTFPFPFFFFSLYQLPRFLYMFCFSNWTFYESKFCIFLSHLSCNELDFLGEILSALSRSRHGFVSLGLKSSKGLLQWMNAHIPCSNQFASKWRLGLRCYHIATLWLRLFENILGYVVSCIGRGIHLPRWSDGNADLRFTF